MFFFLFLWWHDLEHLLICLFAIFSSLVRCLLKSLAHFFLITLLIFVLERFFFLYILDNCHLQICLLQRFSPRLWLVFSFCWHYLNETQLINFFFHWLCLWNILSKKSSPNPKFWVSHMLPSKCCIVLHSTLRSVIHSELMFVNYLCLVFFFLMGVTSSSCTNCWKDSLLHYIAFASFSDISWLIMWVYFWALYLFDLFVCLICLSVLCQHHIVLITVALY